VVTRHVSDVRVGSSWIAGLGVFAARSFAAGETVLLLDDSRVVDDKHPLDAAAGELAHHCDYLAGGRMVLMPSPECYINSSCEPNTWVVTRDGVRHVVALTAIDAGNEVTYDYLINCHGGVAWQCHCGTGRCRGTIPASFFDLPADEQRRLRALLDGWFVAEHADRLRALDQEVGS
jgi:SET domain-containing protein